RPDAARCEAAVIVIGRITPGVCGREPEAQSDADSRTEPAEARPEAAVEPAMEAMETATEWAGRSLAWHEGKANEGCGEDRNEGSHGTTPLKSVAPSHADN